GICSVSSARPRGGRFYSLKQRRICELQDCGISAGQSGTQHASGRAAKVSILFTMPPLYRPDLKYDVVQSENSLIIALHADVFLGDATGQELLLTLGRGEHSCHALEHIIAKDEVVNERRGGMARGQDPKCPRAKFVHQMKRGPQ